ncbi:MAG: hypothetical protein Q7R85_02580 [bacterium]|nr:hypothetical protein [bacterium]
MENYRPVRDNATLLILEMIQAGAMTAVAIHDALNKYSRVNLQSRMRRVHDDPIRQPIFEHRIRALQERQYVHKLLSKLKHEGLVAKTADRNGRWKATLAGMMRVKKSAQRNAYPPKTFTVKQSHELKIVIFDIPERQKGKREWLRAVLKNLRFVKLQQSVWAGKVVLPEAFFDALRALGLLSHVQILAVTKTGSLKHVDA